MNRRRWRQLVACACIAGAATAHAAVASAAPLAPTALPGILGSESEPNDTPAQASPITGDQRIRASLSPAGDVDYYRFEAQQGDRAFANVVTTGSQTGTADSRLTLLKDGEPPTLVEQDDNDGSQFSLGSSIAGAPLEAGVYYLAVEDTRGVSAPPASYDLYLALRSATATAEVEPNNAFTTANPIVNGEVKGVHLEPGAAEQDWFAVNLQAGDTVFLSLDLDPERTGVSWNGRLGFALAGDPAKPQILTVDNAEPADPTPSEAITMTVSEAGTYYAYVDSSDLAVGSSEATYDLAVSVFPATEPNCRTYSPAFTGALVDGGPTTFAIPVEDATQIARAALRLKLQESVMADLDVSLRNPTGTELPVFTDIGWNSSDEPSKRQTQMEATFDDFASGPSLYFAVRPLALRPKVPLATFNGKQSHGTWLLTIVDDTENESAGNLTAAELVLCGELTSPPAPPSPPAGGGSRGTGGQQQQPQQQPRAAPVLSDLTIAPGRFRAAKAGPMVLAKRPKARGALVSYDSSDAAQTNFVLYELEAGRRVGSKCVPPTRANSGRKACVRAVKVISFVRGTGAGRNQFGFTGRVGARKLPPGNYQLKAQAYATSGLVSAPVTATFTVLAPAPVKKMGRAGG